MIRFVKPVDRGLIGVLTSAAPLLLGVSFLMAGAGLTSTLLGVRAGLEGFRPTVVGIVLAGYYVGFVFGSLLAPSVIASVGHIRAFAGFASMASGAVLLHAIRPQPTTWFLLRIVTGLCIAALYVVCEAWMVGVSTNTTRGGLMATYMAVTSASLLAGQILFSLANPNGFILFVLSSLLVSLAVVPVSLVNYSAPSIPEPNPIPLRQIAATAPLGVAGAATAGFVSAGMLSAGVVYASQSGYNQAATAAFVGAALVGGALMQLPLGAWSDRVDRRIVILATALVAAAVAVIASLVNTDRRLVVITLTMIAGGSAFPLYSLSVAHLNDYLDRRFIVAAGSRLVLINGIGSIIGPIAGSAAIGFFRPEAMFVVFAAGYGLVAVYALFRIFKREAADEDERVSFTPVAVSIGSVGVGTSEAEYLESPVRVGFADLDDMVVRYAEYGDGPAVVVIGSPASNELDGWRELLKPLAANGLQVIAPKLGPTRPLDSEDAIEEVLDAVLAVLRDLEVAAATFVGLGQGVPVVLQLGAKHPDRTESVIVGPHGLVEVPPGFTDELTRPALLLEHGYAEDLVAAVADDITVFVRPVHAEYVEEL